MTAAEPGRRVAGRYHLIEPIGRGGMGIVWRAHDELLDRPVAVKEVRYNGASGDELADLNRRTMREARAAGRLTHPNVVVVHDVIEEDGRPWIVMQLVPSRSLGQVIREDGPLPPERVAEIGLEVLKALRNAHAMGVLHRDVKPENVLLADDGRVVLTDFGIARVETDSTMTRTGLVGTPAFMPPERLRGGPAQRESDLWSLGATLYAAVEGRPPHDKGAPLPTMHAVLMDEPEPAVHAGRLAPLIEGLLRKDPEERPGYDQIERMLRRALRPDPMPPPQAASRAASSAIPQTGDSARPASLGEAVGHAGAGSAAAGDALPETGQSLAAERPGKAGADGARPARDGETRPETRPSSGPGASGGEEDAARASASRGASAAAAQASGGGGASAAAEPDAAGSPAKSGTAKPKSSKSGAARSGTAKPGDATAGDEAQAASGAAKPAASAGEPLGPDDPTLPKNPVQKSGTRSAAKPAKKSAAGTGSGKADKSGASAGAPAAAEKPKAAAAKPAGKDADQSLADTTRTQKISAWALDKLGLGRDSAGKSGQGGSERRLGAFEATVSIAKPAARLGAFASKTDEADGTAGDAVDEPASALVGSSGASDARKATGLADAGPEAGDADSAASEAEGPAGEGGEAVPGGSEQDRPDAKDTAGPRDRDGGADDADEPERPATLAEAVRTAKQADSTADATGGTAGSAVKASAAKATGEAEDLDAAGSTRKLPGWPILELDEEDVQAASRDAAERADEGRAPSRAAAAGEADPGRDASGGAGHGATGKDADQARDGDRPARRPARISPFPPPYSRPTPQPVPRFSPEPEPARPHRPRPAAQPPVQPAVAATPAAWHQQVTSPSWQGGLSGLIANPTVKIILIAVPALVAVAVIAALLGMQDAQNDLSRQPADSGGSSAPATPDSEGSRSGKFQSGESGSGTGQSGGTKSLPAPPSASAKPSPGGTSAASTPKKEESQTKPPAAADKLPKGWRRYTDPTGFSVGLPKGWKVHERRGTQVFFRGGERSTFLLIDQTNHPKSDAKRDWLAQEKSARYRFSRYKRVRIKSVDYFKTAADWEWTYYDGGIRLHVINRGFVTDKRHGYAIYWSTPHKRWEKNLHYFRGFVATFKPAR